LQQVTGLVSDVVVKGIFLAVFGVRVKIERILLTPYNKVEGIAYILG
jgi:hypothetical protein